MAEKRQAIRYTIRNIYQFSTFIKSDIFDRYDQKVIFEFKTEKQAEKKLKEIQEKYGKYGVIVD